MILGRWFWAVLLELWTASSSDGCVCQCGRVMQQKITFFLVSWVALSRTCTPRLRVSLASFLSCAAMCHGKCWRETFPLSHSFACTAEVSVTCVAVVYFSSVLVAWQCFNGWSFFAFGLDYVRTIGFSSRCLPVGTLLQFGPQGGFGCCCCM